jgi:hypothetical protein
MGTSPGDIVGRERELAAVGAFLTAVPNGPRALLLEGEAGTGKTTVWLAAVRAAGDRGFRVLQARPAACDRQAGVTAQRMRFSPYCQSVPISANPAARSAATCCTSSTDSEP